MRASAYMGQTTLKVQREKQAVRLDEAGNVNRLLVTVVEID